MPDPYVLPGTTILRNKFSLTTQDDLDDAEADFAALRLRELARNPIEGVFSDIGDKSQKQYLEMIIRDGIGVGI